MIAENGLLGFAPGPKILTPTVPIKTPTNVVSQLEHCKVSSWFVGSLIDIHLRSDCHKAISRFERREIPSRVRPLNKVRQREETKVDER